MDNDKICRWTDIFTASSKQQRDETINVPVLGCIRTSKFSRENALTATDTPGVLTPLEVQRW